MFTHVYTLYVTLQCSLYLSIWVNIMSGAVKYQPEHRKTRGFFMTG